VRTPSSSMKRGSWGWLRRLICVGLMLVLLLALTSKLSYCDESDATVVLTEAQADSLINQLDDLEIRLWEQARYAQIDSLSAATQLRLQAENYEAIIEQYRGDRDNWLEQIMKHPVVWMALGMWIGANAR